MVSYINLFLTLKKMTYLTPEYRRLYSLTQGILIEERELRPYEFLYYVTGHTNSDGVTVIAYIIDEKIHPDYEDYPLHDLYVVNTMCRKWVLTIPKY